MALTRPEDRTLLRLWPLPLVAGVMPCAAVLIAWAVSTQLGLVPACNPFLEGCFSVSRAARHELPNHLFRAIVLPAAALQAVVWMFAARWLAGASGARWLPLLGVLAAIALALYGAFLGTEGAVYRVLRQSGTVVYFGFTCLAMLVTGNAVVHHRRLGSALLRHALRGLLVTLVLLGLANVLVAEAVAPELRDRVQNLSEWWGSLVMTLLFAVLAAIWRRERLVVVLRSG